MNLKSFAFRASRAFSIYHEIIVIIITIKNIIELILYYCY